MTSVRARLRSDTGVTLVELSITIVIVAIMAVLAVSWLEAGRRASARATSDDAALTQARTVRQELDRELRFARAVVSGSATELVVWIDADGDAVLDVGETVTWTFTEGGQLTRATDGTPAIVRATSLDAAESHFTYQPAPPPDTSTVSITLTLAGTNALSPGIGERVVVTRVSLRNASGGG